MAPVKHARQLVAAAVCVLVLVTGCSGTSHPTVQPATAAQTLAAVYKLSGSQQQCLERAFAANRAATRPLASDGPASDADLAALGRVARACIAVSTLADAIVGGAVSGTGGLTATEQTCLRSAVTALSPDDQATMLAGLAVPTALGDIETALLGKITDKILTTCHIPTTPSSLPDVSVTNTSA